MPDDSAPKSTSALQRRMLCAILALCVLNFLAFYVVAILLGGDAVNGYAEGGRYFLRSHGKTTEVSRDVFEYSLWHVRSLFLTHPLGALVGVALWLQDKGGKSNV